MTASAQELAALVARLRAWAADYAPNAIGEDLCGEAASALETQASALSDCDVKLVAAHDEIVGLRAKLAAAEADARRYRWLREDAVAYGSGATIVDGKHADVWRSMDTLDAAIDAALAAPDGKERG